ncbi:DUF6233 domain-containing protein [Streptomyces albidus (ex Kaewkla and Franco 2022)]|uniref:DUF6233 domain-containing protein n=1 Tax=Streptomyces albidus (ex Kaewkla and Franco 2022) TaxID=722709 RepID=UPI0015EEA01E|nr:DUF6233 domain-containing protein [Streptomyces albidus (ex Kaewkla and Franco 2022)]
MSELPLPHDLERLQIIRVWIGEQQARSETIGKLLEILAETIDSAIGAAAPAGPPDTYRIQKMRVPESPALLHRGDCWIAGGGNINRDEALMALADDVTSGQLEMCKACRPEESLEA